MKKFSKVLTIMLVLVTLSIIIPSMAGIAQSFFYNSNLNTNKEELIKENLTDEIKDEDDKKEEQKESKEEDSMTDHTQEKANNNIQDNANVKSDDDVIEIKTDPSKKVFLTFDDGPSSLTPDILKILDVNNVKATFFTIGKSIEKNPQWVSQAYDEGHAVLPHSYTHDYSIYTTFESYYNDLDLAKKSIEDVLGIEIPHIFRFPGGSSNHSSFKYGGEKFMPQLTSDVKEKGYYYIDWNVSSGDASADYDKKDKMLSNVIDGSKNKDFLVVLFHDTARNTKMAEILPDIISELKSQGYTFRTFRDITQDELDTMVKLKLANKPIVR